MLVLVVSALFFVLALTMIYTAGMSMATANKRVYREQSYQLCKSFTKLVERELLENDKDTSDSTTKNFHGYMKELVKKVSDDSYKEKILEMHPAETDTQKTEYGCEISILKVNRKPKFSPSQWNFTITKGENEEFPDPGPTEREVERFQFSVTTTVQMHGVKYALTTWYKCKEVFAPEISEAGNTRYYEYNEGGQSKITFTKMAGEEPKDETETETERN